MNTPDFLQQVVVSEQQRRSDAQTVSRYSGPSSSIVWALLDLVTALVSGLIALRIRGKGVPVPHGERQRSDGRIFVGATTGGGRCHRPVVPVVRV